MHNTCNITTQDVQDMQWISLFGGKRHIILIKLTVLGRNVPDLCWKIFKNSIVDLKCIAMFCTGIIRMCGLHNSWPHHIRCTISTCLSLHVLLFDKILHKLTYCPCWIYWFEVNYFQRKAPRNSSLMWIRDFNFEEKWWQIHGNIFRSLVLLQQQSWPNLQENSKTSFSKLKSNQEEKEIAMP